MTTKIQLRRDTAANWTTANPTLFSGEVGFETDSGKFKIGNGSTAWASLDYFLDSSDLSGYLTLSSASSTYLTQASASTTYQPKVANVDNTEIGYLNGVTSDIQTQIDNKLSTSSASTTYLTQASASTTYLTATTRSIAPTTATITNAVYSGTTITYTANNTFVAGDIVRISGIVYTAGVNFQNSLNWTRATIATASPTQFTVTAGTGANIGGYASGGVATKIQANLQEWQDSSGTALSSVNQFGNNSGAGLVLIDTITVASATNYYLAFNGVFSSAYDSYRIIVTGLFSNNSTSVKLNLTNLGVPRVSNYNYAGIRQSTSTGVITNVFGSSAAFFAAATGTETSPFSHNLSFDIHRPFVASQNKTYSLAGSEGLSDVLMVNGFLQSSIQFDGFAFSGVNTASNIAGTFRIYGYRN